MHRTLYRIFLFVALAAAFCHAWEASWDSLDSRPLPAWYDQAKFGIFIHWGLFSVPAYGTEWFWNYYASNWKDYVDFVNRTENMARFSYRDYASRFDATLYRPDQWASLFAQSGAQYVVLTSKHHEGYCNWDSRDIPSTANWNVMDIGPRRDLLGELATEIKRTNSPLTNQTLKFGVYHSLFEWYHPAFVKDRNANYTTSEFVDSKTLPELYDLVRKYEPEIVWSDGDWDATSRYWKSTEFLAWYATHSAVAETGIWNDRWGNDALCKHGSFLTCDDRYRPGELKPQKWEHCMTIDSKSWGFNRNASYSDYLSTKELIATLIETVAFNGNLLLNVGPSADGTISPIFADRLLGIGEWLRINGQAIYGTRPWVLCPSEAGVHVFYTVQANTDTLYALVTEWPAENRLALSCPHPNTTATSVQLVGYASSELPWSTTDINSPGLTIHVPTLTPNVIPCQHAWVFALTGIQNLQGSNRQTASSE